MFSIVIPIYNKKTSLEVTVTSVLNQTVKEFELILVDDGSNDGSLELIQAISDPRIKVFAKENGGVSSARNFGINKAQQDWVCFLDADDWWHPQYLELLKKHIHANSKAHFFSTKFKELIDQKNWQPEAWKVDLNKTSTSVINNLPHEILKGIPFYTSSVCVHREFLCNEFGENPFPLGESLGEDLDLWFRINEKSPNFHINLALVVYRTEQANSLMSKDNYNDVPHFIFRLLTRAKSTNNKQLAKSYREFYYSHSLMRARSALMAGNRALAISLIFGASYLILRKKWWFALFIALFIPKSTATKLFKKRNLKKRKIEA